MKNIRLETDEELVIPRFAFFHEESQMWFGLEFRINDYNRWYIRTSSFWNLSTEIQLVIEQALYEAESSYQHVLYKGTIQTVVIYCGNNINSRILLQIRAFRFQ
jgi:hypothetical protein